MSKNAKNIHKISFSQKKSEDQEVIHEIYICPCRFGCFDIMKVFEECYAKELDVQKVIHLSTSERIDCKKMCF